MTTPGEAAFGEELRRYRHTAGLTQEALAERAGLGVRTIQGLERGEARPLQATLDRLSRALELPEERRKPLWLLASPAPRQRNTRGQNLSASTTGHRIGQAAVGEVTADGNAAAVLPLPTSPAFPTAWTSFVGREHDLAAAAGLLRATRLLTLTGPAGSGKTRLAVELTSHIRDTYADGAVAVWLAPLPDPALLLPAILRAAGLREEAGRTPAETLATSLHNRHLLLVLDNFEHLLGAAPALSHLLASCPHLTALVTSRAPLHLYGEQEFPVPPLALPGLEHSAEAVTASHYAAVCLFVDRARSVRPDFTLTDENTPAVAAICRRVDGLPLGIELAAAQMKSLSPQAVLSRLDRPLEVLTGGARDLPPRQQSLRNAIAWSYALLDPPEQAVLCQLAVFAGGCTAAAAEAGCDPDGDGSRPVVETLLALADKSLVQATFLGGRDDDEPRFTLLETVRDFAREQLDASGQSDAVRGRHAAYYRSLAETLVAAALSAGIAVATTPARWRQLKPGIDPSMERLRADYDNAREALRWFLDAGAAEESVRLADALHHFWGYDARWTEGRHWMARILAATETAVSPLMRVRVLTWAATMTCRDDMAGSSALYKDALALTRQIGEARMTVDQAHMLLTPLAISGCWEEARTLMEECLHISVTLDDSLLIANAQTGLAWILYNLGEPAQAKALNERAQPIQRDFGDALMLQLTLHTLGQIAHDEGDFAAAERLFDEARVINETSGDRYARGVSLYHLGNLATEQRRFDLARSRLTESLHCHLQTGHWPRLADTIEGFARLAAMEGQPERALVLAGAAWAQRRALHAAPEYSPSRCAHLQEKLALIRPMLSPEQQAAAWEHGRALTPEQAVALALHEPAT